MFEDSSIVHQYLFNSCSYQCHTLEFFWGVGRVQQIQLKTEDRENGDLEAVAP
jgi:hypothetical protein